MSGRRGFLKGLSGLAMSSFFKTSARAQVSQDKEVLRVLQSATGRTSTLLVVMAHRNSVLEIKVQDLAEASEPRWNVERIDLGLGDLVVHQIHVTGLLIKSSYRLEIFDSTRDKSYQRFFKSLDLDHKDPRLAVLTCTNHRNADPQKIMFQKLKESRPDLILFPGDLIYANSAWDTFLGRPATPEEAYAVYCKTLLDFDFYQEENLIPIFSSWDDHDTAFNNSDSNHPNLEIMLKMFRSFFPVDQRVEEIQPGPGVSYFFEAFGAFILFLDIRSFLNESDKTVLGAEQFQWAIKNIEKINKPMIIISAIQFWNYRKFAENFESTAQEEFLGLLSTLKSKKAPVLFLSGDVHYSQVQQIPQELLGFGTYEISSSAMFSLSSRVLGKRSEDEGQLRHYGGPNFLLFEQLLVAKETLAMNVRCISERSNAEFKYNLRIDLGEGSGVTGRWLNPLGRDLPADFQ